ncbi:hypothetical protein [Mesorhizobium sp.]|uniref:hypothetical protein n=1 Tax=Mesorhizobium sp. TaxID=1871066 RepID=UPI0011F86DD9|nr:hypothetical protein [Mesorhizobium sp.]TIL27431.1 MAG: hypothetical protein E5Y85_33330 [Mesorhizobium sp.]
MKNAVIRNDPGPPLNKPYETITIVTSSETFVFTGEGNTARGKLDIVRGGKATPKDKRCYAAIKADGGAKAAIMFTAKTG